MNWKLLVSAMVVFGLVAVNAMGGAAAMAASTNSDAVSGGDAGTNIPSCEPVGDLCCFDYDDDGEFDDCVET